MSSISLSLPSIPSPARIRNSLIRVPLATKVILALIFLFWIATALFGGQNWARLEPERGLLGSGTLAYCDALPPRTRWLMVLQLIDYQPTPIYIWDLYTR